MEEDRRHNQVMENAAMGSAISLRAMCETPWKNGASLDVKHYVDKLNYDPVGKKSVRCMMKELSNANEIKFDGSALTLRPYLYD